MDAHDPITDYLAHIPWFLELSPSQLASLAQISSACHYQAGDVIFCEGDAEDCLYILLEGQAEASVHVPGKGNAVLYQIEPLDILGWSVLTPVVRQRTVTVRTVTNARAICFNSQLLRQMCEDDRNFGYIIMRRIANVVASRLLVTRLALYDLIRQDEK